jgi:hypothetical protein
MLSHPSHDLMEFWPNVDYWTLIIYWDFGKRDCLRVIGHRPESGVCVVFLLRIIFRVNVLDTSGGVNPIILHLFSSPMPAVFKIVADEVINHTPIFYWKFFAFYLRLRKFISPLHIVVFTFGRNRLIFGWILCFILFLLIFFFFLFWFLFCYGLILLLRIINRLTILL